MNIISDINSLSSNPRFDIIHCHFGFHGNRGMLLREIGALKGRLVTTFHGADITVNLKSRGPNIYNTLFAKGDLFLPISRRWRERLIQLGCSDGKIKIHRMGIDCRRFTFKPRMPHSGGPFKIVTIARLTEKKGLEYAIRAVAGLKKKYANVEYTIVGDGPLKTGLELLAKNLGMKDTVHLVGWQEQKRVVEILDRSHLFLLPSVTASNGDQEGIPVVLMEAMAVGLPVVSTRHSGIPELIEDGVSGCLVPEKSVHSLSEKLEYLIENPSKRVELGREGRKKVETQYNINRLNDQLVKIYRQLVETKN